VENSDSVCIHFDNGNNAFHMNGKLAKKIRKAAGTKSEAKKLKKAIKQVQRDSINFTS